MRGNRASPEFESSALPTRATGLLCLLALAGCESYRAWELDADALLAGLVEARERELEHVGTAVTLADATTAMRAHNPRIVRARAEMAEAWVRAEHRTPAANPVLSAGPLLLDGAGITSSTQWGVEAGIGWLIPLGGRRARLDDLDATRAAAALVGAVAAEREEYLALRRELADAALRAESVAAHRALERNIEALAEQQRRLAAAGRASAVDVESSNLEAHTAHAVWLAERARLIDGQGQLASRSGLAPAAFGGLSAERLPPLPETVPPLPRLQAALVDAPALTVLAARYAVAEAELRLEIARQYPDLGIGASYERETEVNRFGLPLGIEVPIFDRNQEGIAAARARRAEHRTQFAAALRERLNALETGRARVLAQRDKLRHMEEQVLPSAAAMVRSARSALEAGRLDAFRLLQLMRREREARVRTLDARRELLAAWSDLEHACGAPLLRFPDEPRPATERESTTEQEGR